MKFSWRKKYAGRPRRRNRPLAVPCGHTDTSDLRLHPGCSLGPNEFHRVSGCCLLGRKAVWEGADLTSLSVCVSVCIYLCFYLCVCVCVCPSVLLVFLGGTRQKLQLSSRTHFSFLSLPLMIQGRHLGYGIISLQI